MLERGKPLCIVILFLGVLTLILSGCDISGGQDEASPVEPYFSYEVYDESGNLLQRVSNERVDEVEIETSLGLFGEQFYPPWIVDWIEETIAEHTDIDPGDINLDKHSIWLHAEQGVQENIYFSMLNFTFPVMEEWNKNTFHVSALVSKEEWVNFLRYIWENMKEFHGDSSGRINVQITHMSRDMDEHSVIINYHESGFGLQGTSYVFLPQGGYVELESVTGEFAEGNFSIDLTGLPADILAVNAEEFPENPEFRDFRITGQFAAEYGDYNDLKQARHDLINSVLMDGQFLE